MEIHFVVIRNLVVPGVVPLLVLFSHQLEVGIVLLQVTYIVSHQFQLFFRGRPSLGGKVRGIDSPVGKTADRAIIAADGHLLVAAGAVADSHRPAVPIDDDGIVPSGTAAHRHFSILSINEDIRVALGVLSQFQSITEFDLIVVGIVCRRRYRDIVIDTADGHPFSFHFGLGCCIGNILDVLNGSGVSTYFITFVMIFLIFFVINTAALHMGDLFPVVVDPVFGDHGTIGDDHSIHGLRLAIPGNRHLSHTHRIDSLCIRSTGMDRGEAGRLLHLDDEGVALSIRRLAGDDIEVGCIEISRFASPGADDPDFRAQFSRNTLAFFRRLVRIMVPQEGDGILPDLFFQIPQLAFRSGPVGAVTHIHRIPASIAETVDEIPGLGTFGFFRDHILQSCRLPANGQRIGNHIAGTKSTL